VMTASEVKSHSSIDRFLVVFHSPTGMAETGLLACRSEKTGRASRCNANTKDFLWSGLPMETSELAGIPRDFREKTSGFLCTPDCVAERSGFELSLPFCRAKPRRVRKLQITKLCQRISIRKRN
jgi:hypothetical protein